VKIALINDVIFGYATGDAGVAGGAEKAQWLIAQALARSGWSVVIGVRKLKPGEEHLIEGVRFVGIGSGNSLGPLRDEAVDLLIAWSKFLSVEKPDWWYWRAADPLWGALLLIAKTKGVRAIFASAFDTDVNPRVALTRRKHWWPLYAWGLSAVDRIFVQHTGQFSGLSHKLQQKANIVPSIVSMRDRVKTYAERTKRVAWIGVLREPKRPDLLIDIAQRNPDLQFVVCGGTSSHRSPAGYGERIVNQFRSLPNIDYLGHVPPQRAAEISADALALLCTSDREGLPNTFLEAWSAGTPVVTLKIDPGDAVREKRLGYVSGTVEQAASDIRALMRSRNVFEDMSSRARKHVEESHSDESVVKIFTRAVQGLNSGIRTQGEAKVSIT